MPTKEKLLDLLAETEDPAKRLAIRERLDGLNKGAEPRRRGPQGERGPSGGEALGLALEAPLRATKESLSGDADIWYERPEWMPHGVWAATQVAADIGLDPLNLVGSGLWAKGHKAATKAYGSIKDAAKGMLTANADNYLPSFYRPDPEAPLTPMQSLVNDRQMEGLIHGVDPVTAANRMSVGAEDIRGASQKLGSTLSSVVQGGKNAFLNVLNPSARALWREKGISYGGQNIIKNHLKRHDELTASIEELRKLPPDTPGVEEAIVALVKQRREERGVAKAGAEAVYQSHNATQGVRKGPKSESLSAFEKQAFDELPQPNTTGTITDITTRHAPQKKVDGEWVDDPLSTADSTFIEQHVNSTWPGTADVVVKTPEKIPSGKHQYDLIGNRNPNMMFFKKLMKEPQPSGVSWADHVEQQARQWNEKAAYKVKVKRNGDDAWVVSSRPGTAIVEGGYNSLHKIEPDGTYIATMSDEHNFLENIPALGKLVQKLLPRNLVAITPPIKGKIGEKDVYRTQATARRVEADKLKPKRDVQNPGTAIPSMQENLYGIANERASDAAIKAERERTAGMLTTLGSTVYSPEEEPTQ